MNEAFIGLNLFFLSLAFVIFAFGVIIIIGFGYMIAEDMHNKIKTWLAFKRFYKSQEEIMKQIQSNYKKCNKIKKGVN